MAAAAADDVADYGVPHRPRVLPGAACTARTARSAYSAAVALPCPARGVYHQAAACLCGQPLLLLLLLLRRHRHGTAISRRANGRLRQSESCTMPPRPATPIASASHRVLRDAKAVGSIALIAVTRVLKKLAVHPSTAADGAQAAADGLDWPRGSTHWPCTG